MPGQIDSSAVPLPFSQIPSTSERFTPRRFYEIMSPLLEQCRGLATVCHTVSMYPDIVHPALTASLEILSEYLGRAHAVLQRWELDVHSDATGEQGDHADV